MIELLGDDGEYKEHMPEQNELPEFLKENDFMSPVLSWQQMLFGRDHPLVQGNGNSVDLECRSQTTYFGPLYAGSDYEELTVIYDTMSKYTALALNNADG